MTFGTVGVGSNATGSGAANGEGDGAEGVAFGRWSSPAENADPEVTRPSSPVGVDAATASGASDVAGGTGVGVTLRVPAGLGLRAAPVRGFVVLGRGRTTVSSGSPPSDSPAGAEDAEGSLAVAAGSFDHRSLSGFASLTVGHLRTLCRLQPAQRYRREHPRPKRLHTLSSLAPVLTVPQYAICLETSRRLHSSFTRAGDADRTGRWE